MQQPPGFPPPASAPPEKRDDDKKIDINVWELSIDKTIDFILIFVGLYAALAVQDWLDARKETEDYVKLLDQFRVELEANKGEKSAIEKDLGLIVEREEGKALGPLQKELDRFKAEATEAETLLKCLGVALGVAQKGQPDAEEEKKLAECSPILESAEKEQETPPFKPINLTPFYRRDVLAIYMAGGVKTFKNADLAVNITQTYSSTIRIEELVKEVENLYNDEFMKMNGEVRVLEAELTEAMPEGDMTPAVMPQVRAQLLKSAGDIRGLRYDMERLQGKLELKAERLKDRVARMDEEIGKVVESIDAEKKKY
jgi:hypothetical protein